MYIGSCQGLGELEDWGATDLWGWVSSGGDKNVLQLDRGGVCTTWRTR